MKKLTRTTLATALMLCMGHASADLDYSQTFFFGDSLTDSGAFAGNADAGDGTSFTTDPGNVWSENLADYLGTAALANNPNNLSTDPNGTNYAQGGAQVSLPVGIGSTPSPQSAQPLTTQLETYLSSTGGTADPNALYSVWGGANDVFYNMILVGSGASMDSVLNNLSNSGQSMAGIVQELADAGAGTIIIPNLPDIGTTPSSVLSVINTAGEGNPNLANALMAAVSELAQSGDDQELNALAAAETILGFPAGALTPAYEQMSYLGTTLSSVYNDFLAAYLEQVDANIILLDTHGLFNEMMTNPSAFMLVNTTGVSCTTSSALPCTSDTLIDPMTPSVFLFADSVHPTTIGHQIFADYAYSVLSAPAQISTLAEIPVGMLRNQQKNIGSHLQNLSQNDDWQIFGSFSLDKQEINGAQSAKAESDDNHFMVGGAKQIGNGVFIGAALNKSNSDVDFSTTSGGFDMDATNLSVFAGYRNETLYANLLATLGLQTDYDIDRMIRLGNSGSVESGSTEADTTAISLEVGATLFNSDGFSAGPFGSLTRQSIDVDGYTESYKCLRESDLSAVPCSTTMYFGDQSRDALLGEIGLFATKQFEKSQLKASVSYEKDFDNDERTIEAGLVNVAQGFTLDNIKGEDDSWNLALEYTAQTSQHSRVTAGFRLRKGDDSDSQAFNIGIQVDL